MKQKVLIKVSIGEKKCCFRKINSQKVRSKALKIVVGVSGVASATLKGDDKDQIEVTGDEFDSVKLITLLRKKVGYAELVSVGPAEEKKKDEKEKYDTVWSAGMPNYQVYEIRDPSSPACSIM